MMPFSIKWAEEPNVLRKRTALLRRAVSGNCRQRWRAVCTPSSPQLVDNTCHSSRVRAAFGPERTRQSCCQVERYRAKLTDINGTETGESLVGTNGDDVIHGLGGND